MTGLGTQYIVDGPMGMFGPGKSSKGFVHKESFYAYIEAVRAMGRTVTVHADHAPVFAVIEPRQEVAV